ncbi:MAG: transposase [Anaerolineae bacterium]|nr:transposase [Anaerolineae bacterium]
MQYSWYGHIALQYWQQIPQPYQIVEIDEVVIMPNHIHGIIIIRPSGEATPPVGVEQCSTSTRTATEQCSVSTTTKHYGLLSKVIKSFKNVVTRQIRLQFEDNEFAWQRSFYDHIIRNENSLHDIRGYIKNNPRKWDLDKDNPASLYM